MGKIRKRCISLEESRIKQMIFFCVSMFFLFVLYSVFMVQLKKQFEIVSDDYSWVYQVDSMEEQDGRLRIVGWAFEIDQRAKSRSFEIVLQDTKTGETIFPRMTYEKREDVNCYFACEYDYTESGFSASLPVEKIEDTVYEVLLHPTEEKYAFSTGIYFEAGKMTYIHPNEFTPLDVAGTDLEKIVTDGVLRVYRPDSGMYVYQYQGELYWIAEEWYGFVDGDSVVRYYMNTTQPQKLPQSRLDKGYLSNNLGFSFADREIKDWDTGKYRVARYEIPTEYSITNIWTGNRSGEWIWREDFRPWYEFD